MKAFIGLGNPGEKYEKTRHNLGFLLLDHFALRHRLTFRRERKVLGLVARGQVGGEEVILLKPQTYMNESGISARRLMDYYGIESDQLFVLLDDVDLPLGVLRLKPKGNSGGHLGLKSVLHHVGCNEVSRLRLGIGRPEGRGKSSPDYVLGTFPSSEWEKVEEMIGRGVEVLEELLHDPLERVMNRANSSTEETNTQHEETT